MSHGASGPRIGLAFRFHANFYHSYRGDTPDELGFGMDMRIIRRILEVLDAWNDRGLPVRATWDVDNHYSLEKIIPEHCPDILEAWQRRVADGRDEFELMSYNNGLANAATAAEFDASIERALRNPEGSGLEDLFASHARIVRPQEMMYTPRHLDLYPRLGIDTISLFYSAVPFNAFSNFVAPLPLEQRYNPLILWHPDAEGTMSLLPAYNHGDIADQLSLRRWLERMRRAQLALSEPRDLLLLIDADADDEFWYGYGAPVLPRLIAIAGGLDGLLASVADLDFVDFTTPGAYLADHPPVDRIRIDHDTADGSYDGFASWAEKWSSHQLWTGIERARLLEMQARRLLSEMPTGPDREALEQKLARSFESRLLSLSTTHFGLTSPVVNKRRLRTATGLVARAVVEAEQAFLGAAAGITGAERPAGESRIPLQLVDFPRGVDTDAVRYEPRPSRAWVRIPVDTAVAEARAVEVVDAAGMPHAAVLRPRAEGSGELSLVAALAACERRDLTVSLDGSPGATVPLPGEPVRTDPTSLDNGLLRLRFDAEGRWVGLEGPGGELGDGRSPLVGSAVRYRRQLCEAGPWSVVKNDVVGGGLLGAVRVETAIPLPKGAGAVRVQREFTLVSGLPHLYCETWVSYPETESKKYDRARARALEQAYDGHWREAMPCELRPALFGRPDRPLRIWKHNHLGHVGHYDLDHGNHTGRHEVDTLNNHVTCGWVAASDRERGLLVAQTSSATAGMAFCPIRLRETESGTRLFLNPFGAYHGRQLPYPTRYSGVGLLAAWLGAPTLDPQAPSFNGNQQHLSLMLAPYAGDRPPQALCDAAMAFHYPYAVVSDAPKIATPSTRRWHHPGVEHDEQETAR
ncbi:MAG: hypothetical protein QF570_15520 [Myxococcota bacterium]|jgi:hypothetical protein|nr:hypothetical protein [Myxococcota bacterium]